jgi:hypothetical protein
MMAPKSGIATPGPAGGHSDIRSLESLQPPPGILDFSFFRPLQSDTVVPLQDLQESLVDLADVGRCRNTLFAELALRVT